MTKLIRLFMLVGCTALLLPLAAGAEENFKEKIHYELVLPPQPTTAPKGKVEVVEMFWYGCPHCNALEPYVNRWLKTKPDNVEFVRIPAVFQPAWELHARAYYTAEILGVLDKTHSAMFEAIHGQRRPMSSEQQIMEFFAEHGVKNEDFKRVFHSFAVEAKVRRAKDLSHRYGIDGVPSLIVNGKYRTGATLAGGNANIFKVVDFLVAKEAKEAK
jgi:thiol:disulfide interchange protein DsbA